MPNHSSRRLPMGPTTIRALTLTEMMVTMAVFALVVLAMVSLQVFGFRINSLSSGKMKYTDDSLNALDQIRNQVLGATNTVLIGNINTGNNQFTALAINSLGIGNAVQISNNANSYVTFYLNTNTHVLYELGSATNSQPLTLAHSIFNYQPFQIENYQGTNILVGASGHYTIKMTLQFSNLVYTLPTSTYDTYRLESRATPREQYQNN